jgi:hypothetical protein
LPENQVDLFKNPTVFKETEDMILNRIEKSFVKRALNRFWLNGELKMAAVWVFPGGLLNER